MERITKILAVSWMLLGSLDVLAGAVLAPIAKEPPPKPGENYSESRFGMPPMQVDTGVGASYAARAVEEMEAPDDGGSLGTEMNGGTRGGSGGRMPASSSFASRGPSADKTTSIPALGQDPAVTPTESAIARKGIQEVALIAGDLGFFPKTVFVTRDVPVRMFVTGASKNTLCIMMDSFQVRKQVRSQKIEEITFTPNNPGKYRFYCPVNGMEGTMIVKDLASAPPAER